jgi:hypothetical protein
MMQICIFRLLLLSYLYQGYGDGLATELGWMKQVALKLV